MKTQYAYSYDREDYAGAFDTPEQAFNEAVKRSEGLSSPPTTIYIGRIVAPDAQTTDHAEGIVEAMNRRAHVDYGDVAARYLKDATAEQIRELDEAISATISDWLKRHNLEPKFIRVTGIREFPVTIPPEHQPRATDEVHEIGLSEMPSES